MKNLSFAIVFIFLTIEIMSQTTFNIQPIALRTNGDSITGFIIENEVYTKDQIDPDFRGLFEEFEIGFVVHYGTDSWLCTISNASFGTNGSVISSIMFDPIVHEVNTLGIKFDSSRSSLVVSDYIRRVSSRLSTPAYSHGTHLATVVNNQSQKIYFLFWDEQFKKHSAAEVFMDKGELFVEYLNEF